MEDGSDPLADELRWLVTHRLTREDVELLPLLVMGLSSEEIAERLTLSYDGVTNRVWRLHHRLELATRAQVVYYALVLGLVTIRPSEAGERLAELRARCPKEAA